MIALLERVLGAIPRADSEKIWSFWRREESKNPETRMIRVAWVRVIEDAEWIAAAGTKRTGQNSGNIVLNRDILSKMKLSPDGDAMVSAVFAHELAHVFRLSAGLCTADDAKEEELADALCNRWGYSIFLARNFVHTL